MTGEYGKPFWVAVKSDQIPTKRMVIALTMSLAPVIIAVLISNPALRQRIIMRGASYTRRFCQSQADAWQKAATNAAQAYNKARM